MKKNSKPDFDLIDMLRAVYEKAWIVILAAAVFAAAAFAWTSLFIKPKYETSVTFYVKDSSFAFGNTGVNLSDGDLDETPHPVSSYNIILKTEECLSEISEKADVGYSSSEISARVSAGASSSSEAFKVSVWDHSPEKAVAIANAVAEILPGKTEKIIEGCEITPIESARPAAKSSPSVKKNTVLGLLAGIFISALIVIIRKYTDPKIRSEEYITEETELPLLSAIPNLKNAEELSDSAKKEFGKLRNAIFRLKSEDTGAKVIGITGVSDGGGRTFTVLNLARVMAKANKRVLIIDADIKNNSIAKAFEITEAAGVSEMVGNGKFAADSIKTIFLNTDAITAGNPTEASDIPLTDIISEIIGNTREKYDYITVKLPSVKNSSEAAAFAPLSDGIIIVARKDLDFKADFADAEKEIGQAGGIIVGAVFNGKKPSRRDKSR